MTKGFGIADLGEWLKFLRQLLDNKLCAVLREQRRKVNSFKPVFFRKHSNSDIVPRASCLESGDHAGGVPPVPISNTEVKRSSADDT